VVDRGQRGSDRAPHSAWNVLWRLTPHHSPASGSRKRGCSCDPDTCAGFAPSELLEDCGLEVLYQAWQTGEMGGCNIEWQDLDEAGKISLGGPRSARDFIVDEFLLDEGRLFVRYFFAGETICRYAALDSPLKLRLLC